MGKMQNSYKDVWRDIQKGYQMRVKKDTKDNGRDMMLEFNMIDQSPFPINRI